MVPIKMVPIEPISFSVGVATLFSTCIEGLKYIDAGRSRAADYKSLELQYDIVKERMLIWGNTIGIGNTSIDGSASTDETLILRCLEQIQSLLEDKKIIQQKYGLNEVDEIVTKANFKSLLPSFQPMNVFRSSQFYVRLRGRKAGKVMQNAVKNMVWAIFDKEKFESLIQSLKTLVEGLERIYPVPITARDQAFHASIANISLEKLSLLPTACDEIYPELDWASIARTVIDASDLGTLDLRNIQEWQEDGNMNGARTRQIMSRPFIDHFEVNTKISIVFTRCCLLALAERPCEPTSLGIILRKEWRDLPYSHARTQIFPWNLSNRIFKDLDFPEILEMDKLELGRYYRESISKETPNAIPDLYYYIYCAPCICQIQTALHICERARGLADFLLSLQIRIDNRFTATCCPDASVNIGLASIREYFSVMTSNGDLPRYMKWIDMDWLDQRLYSEQYNDVNSEAAQRLADNISIVGDGPYGPGTTTAGILILGERDRLVPMVSRHPFHYEHVPQENQIFRVARRDHMNPTWSLNYFATYDANEISEEDYGTERFKTPTNLSRIDQNTQSQDEALNSALGALSPSSKPSSNKRKASSSSVE